MIHIEYAGNKPIISHTGIDFTTKIDKYEYIAPAYHILHMFYTLDGAKNVEDIRHVTKLDEDDLLSILRKVLPDFDKFYKDHMNSYEEKLDQEVQEVENKCVLNDLEQHLLVDNLKIMRNYRIQRATNKLVYEEMINASVLLVKTKKIQKIRVPFSMPFLHVLTSLQTTLQREKNAPQTDLHVRANHEESFAELNIHFL